VANYVDPCLVLAVLVNVTIWVLCLNVLVSNVHIKGFYQYDYINVKSDGSTGPCYKLLIVLL